MLLTLNNVHSSIVSRFVKPETGLFQYFIKVVPTSYVSSVFTNGEKMFTNQYVFTEKFRTIQLPDINDPNSFQVSVLCSYVA